MSPVPFGILRRAFTRRLLALGLVLAVSGLGAARAQAEPATPVPRPAPASIGTLPRVPWEGGSRYWSQFPKASAAGWNQDSFFPVVVWYGSCVKPEQVPFDRAYGVNTYAQCNPAASYDTLVRNRMFSLFPTVGQPADAVETQQVGTLLDDEVDGRYEPDDGLALMRGYEQNLAGTGRFGYANWTSGLVTYDRSMSFSADYFDTTDVNSVDQYFYSVPHCRELPLRWRTPALSPPSTGRAGTEINRSNCRTSASYGKLIDLQHEVDQARGQYAPIWAVLETVGIGDTHSGLLTQAQVEGMAMSSLIHEARGIVWFSQSFDDADWNSANPCGSGDSFASMREDPTGYPCRAAMAGVRSVGSLVKTYAPVLNTQSVVWNFGPGTDTMLKIKGRYAYVFAMADGRPGPRTFTVPGGLQDKVWVLGENREKRVVNGTFSDSFATESSFHIYAIPLQTRVSRTFTPPRAGGTR